METLLQVTASWILPALFFWVLLSLITMMIVELIQSLSGSRQKGLEEVLKTMMGEELAKKFYSHALVVPLGKYKPAYISSSLFAKVILDWILPKAQVPAQDNTAKEQRVDVSAPVDSQSKNKVYECTQIEISNLARKNAGFACVIQAIVDQANMKSGKLSEFIDLIQTDLENWFLGAVNQMSPVYGGRLRWVTLTVSLFVAIAANFDVVSITSRLWITSKYMEVLNIVEKNRPEIRPSQS
jgi:hypothetical protein